jgi:hypothetical protein
LQIFIDHLQTFFRLISLKKSVSKHAMYVINIILTSIKRFWWVPKRPSRQNSRMVGLKMKSSYYRAC